MLQGVLTRFIKKGFIKPYTTVSKYEFEMYISNYKSDETITPRIIIINSQLLENSIAQHYILLVFIYLIDLVVNCCVSK